MTGVQILEYSGPEHPDLKAETQRSDTTLIYCSPRHRWETRRPTRFDSTEMSMNTLSNREALAEEAWGELLEIAGSYKPEQVAITQLLLQLILKKVFAAFEDVIPRLGARDHDLISRIYGLEDHYPPKASSSPFETPSASRQAESRARRRLAEATDEWLEEDLKVHPEDWQIIRFARETVRGERILKVIELEAALSGAFPEGELAEKAPREEQWRGGTSPESNEVNGFQGVLVQLQAALEEVQAGYLDLTRRELAWSAFRDLVTGSLWETVEHLEDDPYRQQLADVLDAAVTKLEAFQLSERHFSAVDFTLARLSTRLPNEADVEACEDAWQTAEVDTIPKLQEAFGEWLTNSYSGAEDGE